MKGRGYKAKRAPGKSLHQRNTQLTVAHILDMLARYEELTLDDLRVGIFETRRAAGLSMADAYDAATARVNRALRWLRKPIVECVGLKFPYLLATKNDHGIVIYSRFEDWTADEIKSYLDNVQEPNRAACDKKARETRAEMGVLIKAMNRHHVEHAGELEWQADLFGDLLE